MNYKVLYRKYRPNDFENIIGQEYIIKTLKNSIINNNISHAYIFSGPRGTGKTSTAKVFAKAINCLNPKNGSPCGKCDFCKNFVENPDIIEIDAASNNGVDEIRELIDNVKLSPTNGKYKVYIIDEVHMLTTSAFNALLLTLEEPPSHIVFILATTNIENVPITILSRCQRFDFQKISIDEMVDALKNVCKKENIDIDDDALKEIAYLSEGGMRDALSLLDQMSKNKEKITLELVENQVKTISKKSIDDLINTIENSDIERFLKLMLEYKNRSVDYKSLIKKIIDNLSERAKKIKKTEKYSRLSFIDYKKLIMNLTDVFSKINVNVNPYIILEMTFLEFFDDNNVKMNIKENPKVELIKNDVIKPSSMNDNIVNLRINNCFVDAKKQSLELLKEKLGDVTFKNIDGKIKSILMDSTIVAASDEYAIFSCINDHLANSANEKIEEIEKILKLEYDLAYKIIFISSDRWQKEKNEYILNLKMGKKYSLIEEKQKAVEPIINNVFDISKVEII